MTKGRNAAKTFTATRGARFAETRRQTAEWREEQRRLGKQRTLLLVTAEDVQEGDEVLTENGFKDFTEVDQTDYLVQNGETAVRRFVVEE